MLFLAERYGRMTLTLDEVADQVGLAAGTIRNRRTKGEFGWLKTDGRSLYADVADVAQYLEDRRDGQQKSPPHSGTPNSTNTLQPELPQPPPGAARRR